MSMVFKFRMLSDENDRFVRDYEVMYDMSLADFEGFIREDLEYDPAMTSFFTADDRWNKLREFTLEDMGDMGEEAPVPMASVVLGQLMHRAVPVGTTQQPSLTDYPDALDVMKWVKIK